MQLISHSGYNVIRGWNHAKFTNWDFFQILREKISGFLLWSVLFPIRDFFPIREIRCFFGVVENQKLIFFGEETSKQITPHGFAAKILRKRVPKNFSVTFSRGNFQKTTTIHTNDVCGLSWTSARRLGRPGKVLTGVISDNQYGRCWMWNAMERSWFLQ